MLRLSLLEIKSTPLIAATLLALTSSAGAANCTEDMIRAAAAAGQSFNYTTQGCTNPGGIIEVTQGIRVNSDDWSFDGAGVAHLVWKGDGECDRFPRNGNFAFFNVHGNRAHLSRFTADGAPEGIHIETGDSSTVESVHFTIVCEKSIRNGNKADNAATNTVIKNCIFDRGAGPADHTVLVQGGSITVQDSIFNGGRVAIAACAEKANPGFHEASPCQVPSKITALRNQVNGCDDYGMRSAGKDTAAGGFLIATGNTFRNCKTPLQVEEQGHLESSQNTFLSPCKAAITNLSSGASGVYGCGNKNSCSKTLDGPGLTTTSGCH